MIPPDVNPLWAKALRLPSTELKSVRSCGTSTLFQHSEHHWVEVDSDLPELWYTVAYCRIIM